VFVAASQPQRDVVKVYNKKREKQDEYTSASTSRPFNIFVFTYQV
jgi:hypothetical protein